MFQFYILFSNAWSTYKQYLSKIYIFFILIFILFPLIFSPLKELFYLFYGSIFWFSVLITNFLSIEYLFKQEFQIGFFDYFCQQRKNLEIYIIYKTYIFWFFNILPLIFICFCYFFLVLHITLQELLVYFFLVSLQTLSLTFLHAIGSVFLQQMQQNYILSFLVLIPLMIPILLFGVNLMNSIISFLAVSVFQVLVVVCNFCFILILVPWLISYLIKININ